MSRRKSVISTYGRHRNRVVTIGDPWSKVGGIGSSCRTKVFNSSGSSNDSLFSLNDVSSSLTTGRTTRSTRKTENKENQPKHISHAGRTSRLSTRKRKQTKAFSLSDSNSGHDSTTEEKPRRALRDRSNANRSNDKKEERPTATARNKNTTFRKRGAQAKQESIIEIVESSVENFSEFEGYSLIISDSPVAKKTAGSRREVRKGGAISTSTPETSSVPPPSQHSHLRLGLTVSSASLLSPRVVELRNSVCNTSKPQSPTSATKTPNVRSGHSNSGSKTSISTSTPHLSHVETRTPAIDDADLSNISSPICSNLSIVNSPEVDLLTKVTGCSVALQRLKLDEHADSFHTPLTECRLHGHNGVIRTPTGGTCHCDVDDVFSDSSQRMHSVRENLSAIEHSIELSHITERRGRQSSSDSSTNISNITERQKRKKVPIDTSFVTERPRRAYNTRATNSRQKSGKSTKNISQQSLFDDSFEESTHIHESLDELSLPSRVLRSGRKLGVHDHEKRPTDLGSSHHELCSINEQIEDEEEDEDEEDYTSTDEEDDEELESEDEEEEEEEELAETSALSDIEECSDEEEEEEEEDEDEDEETSSDAGDDEDQDESVTEGSSSYSTAEEPCSSNDVTRYMLASNPPSTESSTQMTPECRRRPPDSRLNCLTPGRVNSVGRPLTRAGQLLGEDLDISCQSLKALTPVKTRRSGRILTEEEKVLHQCHQSEPISFEDCIPPMMMKKCVKIGEGVYGEVFRSERQGESIALKVIPIEGDFPVNDEPQKTFAEILPEIVISKELSDLAMNDVHQTFNFVQVNSVAVVQGCYPPILLKQWDLYHKKKGSENDRPDVFTDEQLFIIFEFEDSGHDLESFQLQSLYEARSVLHQVTCSLAIAEQALQFEHRDLHWGNVLVKRTGEEVLPYRLEGSDVDLEAHGVKVAIIDFTLSRLSKEGCHVFTDLSSDPTLFEGHGDYQFDVYRKMKEENGNEWEGHHPYTNVLWIHYLADKLLHLKKYKDATNKEHKLISREFRTFIREATDFRSALHLLHECSFFQDCGSFTFS